MSVPEVTTRRATLDDLEGLRGLWREACQPEYELEKRFTEFQLAFDAHGWILGALGMRFAGAHAELHSLAMRRADLEKKVGSALWDRVIALAQKQGIHRLWTRCHGSFWTDHGFARADPAQLRELPATLGGSRENWSTLKLREEPLKLIAAEEQLQAYLELERIKTDRLVRRGRVLRIAATAIAAIVFAFAIGALLLLLRRGRGTRRAELERWQPAVGRPRLRRL